MLDWEHDLPEPFFSDSVRHSKSGDVSVVLGSSLQIQPANKLPTYSQTTVIINLSKTKMDKKADLIINGKCDEVMVKVMKELDIPVPHYTAPKLVPTSNNKLPAAAKRPAKRKSKNVDSLSPVKQPKSEDA